MLKGIKIEKKAESKDKAEGKIEYKENKEMLFNFLGKKLPIEEEKDKIQPKSKAHHKDKGENIEKKSKGTFNYYTEIGKSISSLFDGKMEDFNATYSRLEMHKNNRFLNSNRNALTGSEVYSNNLDQTDFELIALPEVDFNNVYSKCNFCYSNQALKNSIISSGSSIYIAYPYDFGSITEYHLILSSFEHFNSSAGLPSNIHEELQKHKNCIVGFNHSRGYSTVFLEFSKARSLSGHFIIEAIPIKIKYIEESKMYFKKAFGEQDTDWSENKQLVETFEHGGNLKKFLNQNFSFVNVDFDCKGGYLHVISDLSKFNCFFLKEILGDHLKLTVFEIRSPVKLGPSELLKRVEEYKQIYLKFDWRHSE